MTWCLIESPDPVARSLGDLHRATGLSICVYCMRGLDGDSRDYYASMGVQLWWYDANGVVHHVPLDLRPFSLVACRECILSLGLKRCEDCGAVFPRDLTRSILREMAPVVRLAHLMTCCCPDCAMATAQEWQRRPVDGVSRAG